MLCDFKGKPFSLAFNYQGIDIVVDFWAENIAQVNSQFTVNGTLFKKNGAKLAGRIVIDVIKEVSCVKIKGDRTPYRFEPTFQSVEYWSSFVNKLKESI